MSKWLLSAYAICLVVVVVIVRVVVVVVAIVVVAIQMYIRRMDLLASNILSWIISRRVHYCWAFGSYRSYVILVCTQPHHHHAFKRTTHTHTHIEHWEAAAQCISPIYDEESAIGWEKNKRREQQHWWISWISEIILYMHIYGFAICVWLAMHTAAFAVSSPSPIFVMRS